MLVEPEGDEENEAIAEEAGEPPLPAPIVQAKTAASFICPECHKSYTRSTNLKDHLRSHNGTQFK